MKKKTKETKKEFIFEISEEEFEKSIKKAMKFASGGNSVQ